MWVEFNHNSVHVIYYICLPFQLLGGPMLLSKPLEDMIIVVFRSWGPMSDQLMDLSKNSTSIRQEVIKWNVPISLSLRGVWWCYRGVIMLYKWKGFVLCLCSNQESKEARVEWWTEHKYPMWGGTPVAGLVLSSFAASCGIHWKSSLRKNAGEAIEMMPRKVSGPGSTKWQPSLVFSFFL